MPTPWRNRRKVSAEGAYLDQFRGKLAHEEPHERGKLRGGASDVVRVAPGRLLLVGLFIVSVIVGVYFRGASSKLESERPLEIDQSDLRFGEAWARRDFRWTIPIRNRSQRSVEVADLRLSCKCTGTIEPRRFVLEPGQTQHVDMTLDLRPTSESLKKRPSFPLSVQMLAMVERPGPLQQTWPLEGIVRQLAWAEPDKIDFFEELVEGAEGPERRVRVTCFEPTTSLEMTCTPNMANVAALSIEGSDREFDLFIRPSSKQPIGPFESTIIIRPAGHDSPDSPYLELPLLGTVMPDIRTLPGVVQFGPVVIGKTATEYVNVDSRLGHALKIAGSKSDCESLEVRVPDGAEKDSSRLTVSVTPREAGFIAESVTASVVDNSGVTKIVSIPVTWYGTGNDD
jgi:hypothetical protein